MPNEHHRSDKPRVLDVRTFHQRFGSDADCLRHLKETRWGLELERFLCPKCGSPDGWWLKNRCLVECTYCRKQTSVTAGTVFHRRRTLLWKWFWALYQLAQDKKGIAALELAKQISVSYTTAWLMLQKLRRAMRQRNERYLLEGVVDLDDAFVGGVVPGRRGRGSEHKVPVIVAVEHTADGKPRRIAMASVSSVDGHSLKRFAAQTMKPGCNVRTDGLHAYRSLAQAGYQHDHVTTGSGREAVKIFPWLHTFIGNMKRMILGTHHHVSPKYLDNYLAEFCYRANRRWREADMFERLVTAAVAAKAVTYKELVTGAI